MILYRLLTILDWILIAASLFNTITMLWLGLTVLLTAERRVWGTYLAAAGLVLGGLFFAGHTAVVGRVLGDASDEMIFYWRLGWLVLIVVPFLWYVVMAWYAGALGEAGRRGERGRLIAIAILGLINLGLASFVDPLPSYGEIAHPPDNLPALMGAAAVVRLLYPAFAALCIMLSLVVLRAPAASDRFMGDLARRRARPWLIAASLVLLALCLVVGIGAAYFLELVRSGLRPEFTAQGIALVIAFDLAACLLCAAAAVLVGQAVVAYEIFTGSALPRGQLARGWRRTLLFGAGYGLAVGWSMSGAGLPELPVYQVLIATLITTVFFALLGWRAFAERGPALGRLRPFLASQHLYERLTTPGEAAQPPADPADDPFRALADEVLGARVAHLLPLGPMATMAGPAVSFPAGAAAPASAVAELIAGLSSPPPLCLPVEPERHAGAVWAVPLRGERGLIGMLLLGEKADGGIYTREEIELARAAGERLLDTRAGAEIARRLVDLQRRRLAESQVLDRRTRRVLHDEVLPQIHTALISLQAAGVDEGGSAERPAVVAQLIAVHRQISDLLHALPPAAGAELARLGPLLALRRVVEAELADAFDGVRWSLDPAAEAAARSLDPISAETLYYAAREAVRNAARHGRGADPARPLHLAVSAARCVDPDDTARIELLVEDDGVGLGSDGPAPGGSGRGLALHGTILAILGGSLNLDSGPGRPTRVTLSLPLPASS